MSTQNPQYPRLDENVNSIDHASHPARPATVEQERDRTQESINALLGKNLVDGQSYRDTVDARTSPQARNTTIGPERANQTRENARSNPDPQKKSTRRFSTAIGGSGGSAAPKHVTKWDDTMGKAAQRTVNTLFGAGGAVGAAWYTGLLNWGLKTTEALGSGWGTAADITGVLAAGTVGYWASKIFLAPVFGLLGHRNIEVKRRLGYDYSDTPGYGRAVWEGVKYLYQAPLRQIGRIGGLGVRIVKTGLWTSGAAILGLAKQGARVVKTGLWTSLAAAGGGAVGYWAGAVPLGGLAAGALPFSIAALGAAAAGAWMFRKKVGEYWFGKKPEEKKSASHDTSHGNGHGDDHGHGTGH